MCSSLLVVGQDNISVYLARRGIQNIRNIIQPIFIEQTHRVHMYICTYEQQHHCSKPSARSLQRRALVLQRSSQAELPLALPCNTHSSIFAYPTELLYQTQSPSFKKRRPISYLPSSLRIISPVTYVSTTRMDTHTRTLLGLHAILCLAYPLHSTFVRSTLYLAEQQRSDILIFCLPNLSSFILQGDSHHQVQ